MKLGVIAATSLLWLASGAMAQIGIGPGGSPDEGGVDPLPFPSPGVGGIVGSAHDFSGKAWADGEICKPCHTPHNAMADVPRLWNHQLTVATYDMHAGSGSAELDFDVVSRMCLSCHDGTVALDSFGGQAGSSFIDSDANLGTDLTNDHPVGSDAEYPPEDKPSWWDGSFKDKSTLPASMRLKKWTSKHTGNSIDVVSCATCHNVHNRYDHDNLLTVDNTASGLCLACHIK